MAKNASLTIRIPAELKLALETAAEKDGRSTSSLAERILTEWVKTRAKRPR